jgi:hypothetical protein
MSDKIPVAQIGASPEEPFKVYTSTPEIGFLRRGVQPPSTVYVDVGDDIQIGCASSQTNETVTVSYRLLRAVDGVIVLGQFAVHPKNDRSVQTYTESLTEGFLLSVSCQAAVATTRGQTFVRVFLTAPELGNGRPSYMLMADYVTTAMSPAHPNGRVLAPSEGPGWPHSVFGTAPLAGFQWAVTVPANARWAVRTGQSLFTTDAVVANRQTGIVAIQAGNQTFQGMGEVVIPASQSVVQSLSLLRNVPAAGSGIVWVPLPKDLLLLGGDRLNSLTLNMDAGDSYLAPVLGVEEWLDNV